MTKPEDLTNEQLLLNAVLWLIHGQYHEAATLLVECELDEYIRDFGIHHTDPPMWYREKLEWSEIQGRWYEVTTLVILSAPAFVQQAIGSSKDTVFYGDLGEEEPEPETQRKYRGEIEKAFCAILRRDSVTVQTHPQLIVESEGDWREHLRELAKGKVVTNQGTRFQPDQSHPIIAWKNLNFRSKSEVDIAKALDRKGVMYFPNCMARLGPPEYRYNKEPDFLICHQGKWGILEVDSPEFHPSRGNDDERDRQFKLNGIKVIERYQWRNCQDNPDDIVSQFIALLDRA